MSFDDFICRAIAVPFVDKGRGWSGWDCWGMLRLFYHEVLGISLPSYAEGYADAGQSAETRNQLRAVIAIGKALWRCVPAPEVGDVVLLNIGGHPLHVGLALGHGRMLHAERRVGTLIERLSSPIWARRVEGFYRYDG